MSKSYSPEDQSDRYFYSLAGNSGRVQRVSGICPYDSQLNANKVMKTVLFLER